MGKYFDNIKYEKTGGFYIRKHGGSYIFINPEGCGFYPIGINHLGSVFSDYTIDKSRQEIESTLLSNLEDWGFNCGGYGTPHFLSEKICFMGSVNLVKHGFYLLDNTTFPDVFDKSFDSFVEDIFQKAKWQYQPERLIGLVWTDCPSWNIFKSRALRQTDWVSEIRNMDYDAPGKKIYLDFLRRTYRSRMEALMEYYNLSEEECKDLDNYDFSNLYLGHPMVIADDKLFMAEIADQYYKIGAKHHRKHFPNIPILGDRYLLGDHPDEVIQVASKYIDAVSVQVGDGFGDNMLPSYPFPENELEHLHKVSEKPVLICDHQISFYTDEYRDTIFSQAGDEQTASIETVKFLEEAYSRPYICGYFRCTYLTIPAKRGRGIKQGLVDCKSKVYSDITQAYSYVNNRIIQYKNSIT